MIFVFQNLYYFSCNFTFGSPVLSSRMPLKKKKTYARFNVGVMMKAKREFSTKSAIAHKSVQEAIKTVDALNAKRRRLETRVCKDLFFSFFIPSIRIVSSAVFF